MRSLTKPIGYLDVLPGMLLVYMSVLVWEFLSMPHTSHQGSTRGITLSLLALPAAAFGLAQSPGSSSRFFVFGVVGSVLFFPRFLNIDRFALWVAYVAPPIEVIVGYWVMFILGMGVACWLSAKLRNLATGNTVKNQPSA